MRSVRTAKLWRRRSSSLPSMFFGIFAAIVGESVRSAEITTVLASAMSKTTLPPRSNSRRWACSATRWIAPRNCCVPASVSTTDVIKGRAAIRSGELWSITCTTISRETTRRTGSLASAATVRSAKVCASSSCSRTYRHVPPSTIATAARIARARLPAERARPAGRVSGERAAAGGADIRRSYTEHPAPRRVSDSGPGLRVVPGCGEPANPYINN